MKLYADMQAVHDKYFARKAAKAEAEKKAKKAAHNAKLCARRKSTRVKSRRR